MDIDPKKQAAKAAQRRALQRTQGLGHGKAQPFAKLMERKASRTDQTEKEEAKDRHEELMQGETRNSDFFETLWADKLQRQFDDHMVVAQDTDRHHTETRHQEKEVERHHDEQVDHQRVEGERGSDERDSSGSGNGSEDGSSSGDNSQQQVLAASLLLRPREAQGTVVTKSAEVRSRAGIPDGWLTEVVQSAWLVSQPNGASEFHIQLTDQTLGAAHVTVESRDGKINVHFSTINAAAAGTIRSGLERLRERLAAAELSAGELTVAAVAV